MNHTLHGLGSASTPNVDARRYLFFYGCNGDNIRVGPEHDGYLLDGDCTEGGFQFDLPKLSSVPPGFTVTCRKSTAANILQVDPHPGDIFHGGAIYQHIKALGAFVTYSASGNYKSPRAWNVLAANDYVESDLLAASAVTLTTATAKTITSIVLGPGDWEISAISVAKTNVVTMTRYLSLIGTTTDSLTGTLTGQNAMDIPLGSTTAADLSVSIPAWQTTLTAATTYYLIAYALFSAGTGQAYGSIHARRVG